MTRAILCVVAAPLLNIFGKVLTSVGSDVFSKEVS